jgi:hypothetical protein
MSLPLPPPLNPNVQIYHVGSPVQSSHASKRLKTDMPQPMQDKGKVDATPSSPSDYSSKSMSSHKHLKDYCSHVINEIHPQGSNQPQATSGKSKGDICEKRKIVLPEWQVWLLDYVFLLFELMKTVLLVFRMFGQQALFWCFVDNVDIYIFFGYDINYL